jgi:hypothetical protein
MPPLGQYLPWSERQTSPLLPPKGTDPGPLWLFPCKLEASWEPRWGPRWRSRTPLAGTPPRVGCINSVRPARICQLARRIEFSHRIAAETLIHPQALGLSAKYHFQLRFVRNWAKVERTPASAGRQATQTRTLALIARLRGGVEAVRASRAMNHPAHCSFRLFGCLTGEIEYSALTGAARVSRGLELDARVAVKAAALQLARRLDATSDAQAAASLGRGLVDVLSELRREPEPDAVDELRRRREARRLAMVSHGRGDMVI